MPTGKRELIDTGTDKRYVRRDDKGRFEDVVDVGKSFRRTASAKRSTRQSPVRVIAATASADRPHPEVNMSRKVAREAPALARAAKVSDLAPPPPTCGQAGRLGRSRRAAGLQPEAGFREDGRTQGPSPGFGWQPLLRAEA